MKHSYTKILIDGNIFEIFDFFVFVFLSNVIAYLFSPKYIIGLLSILLTYTEVTISYILRLFRVITLDNLINL